MSSLKLKRKRSERASETSDDRISNLPNNVTQQILECLPLKEAAKTSILSSHWRSKWASISQLVFDKIFFKTILEGRSRTADSDISSAYSKVVNNVLLSHVGPVSKFVLYLPHWFSKETDIINQWIQYVRAKGVKEVTLEGNYDSKMSNIPSCLFSCVALTHLTIAECDHFTIPPTFRGFPCLVSLNLSLGDSKHHTAALESLIPKCPMLETLYIRIYDTNDLTIHASKLQDLRLEGCIIKGISLEGTTVIKRLDLNIHCWYFQKSKNIGAFFSCLPKVEELVLGNSFCENIGCDKIISPKKFAQKFEHLRILQLFDIALNCSRSISLLLSIVQSSPNLEQLSVKAKKNEKVSDEVMIDGSCNLNRLRNVQLVNISGLNNESQLIKFILASSPTLKEMNIELDKNLVRGEDKYQVAKELMRYKRASPDAEINFEEKKFRI